MLFHPLRDIILTLLAGCLGIVTHGQGPSSMSGHSGEGARFDIIAAGTRPQPFAPGIVASKYEEWATSFSPDNQTVYFSRGGYYWTVCFSQYKGGEWQRPQVASFSGKWKDTDPFVSPDGNKLFFVSNRPVEGETGVRGSASSNGGAGAAEGEGKADGSGGAEKPNANFHLWYVERLPGGSWGIPHHIGDAVNIDSGNNYGPSVSARGTLYWCSRNRQGNQGMQGYYAEWLGDHYDRAKMVTVPGVSSVQDPFIAADEKYLVFLSGSDLYITFRAGQGWGPAQKLGPEVNDGGGNSSPYVSHDGTTLYFSSNRVKGFYERRGAALNYDQVEKENDNWCNGSGNILMIPIRLPQGM